MLKTVLLDVMGVIFTEGDDTNNLLIPFIQAKRPETKAQTLQVAYHRASLGEITAQQFWQAGGFTAEQAAEIEREYLTNSLTLDAEFLPAIQKIKTGYQTALLSNDVAEWSTYLRRLHGFEAYIDHAFISSTLGLRKPDPAIYHKALTALCRAPHECLFVDDDPRRVEAAAALGINAILFNRLNQPYSGLQVRSFTQLTALLF